MTSPTQRSLALLRQEGWTAAVVERWNPHAGVRQDLFGFADLVAVRAGRPGVLAVQVTTGSHQAARLRKALGVPALRAWLAAGNRFEVHGWAKAGPRGGRETWQVHRRPVRLEELAAAGARAGTVDGEERR